MPSNWTKNTSREFRSESSEKPVQPAQLTQPAQPAKPSGHYETRQDLVSSAYDEPIYEVHAVGVKCNTCGQIFKTDAEFDEHAQDMSFNHNDYTHGSDTAILKQVQVGTRHHDAVYKTEQVWVQD